MPIIGAHVLLYTPEPEKLRAVFRDVFGWHHVDAGEGWLIFRVPPAELGIHPSEDAGAAATQHQFSLMCSDITGTIAELRSKGVEVDGEPEDHGYGIVVMLTLPGGVLVQLYEPRHPIAADVR